MKRPKILVTGGPVAVNLDAVKIITNKFKGGRMVGLARELSLRGADVTYLSSEFPSGVDSGDVLWVRHEGFHHYRKLIMDYAPHADAIVLGAAVANLIPDQKWKETYIKNGKFPSHDYKEDDPVPVLFRIAPRIINSVRDAAPRAKLIGFKLLSGVDHAELIRAAQVTQRESRANLVIANDATNLDRRFAVTPEGGWFPVDDLAALILETATDQYFKTLPAYHSLDGLDDEMDKNLDVAGAVKRLCCEADSHRDELMNGKQQNGMIFGCVAVRVGDSNQFVISSRGKRSLREWTLVTSVDHKLHHVRSAGYSGMQSLNAPLIDRIFQKIPDANAVIHWHEDVSGEDGAFPYARPGTVRDTERDVPTSWNEYNQIEFTIAGHGKFLVLR